MKTNKKWIMGALFALLFVGTTFAVFATEQLTIAQTNWTTYNHGENHKGRFMNQLTEEQREIFSQRIQEIKELKESGASQEEMREAKLQLMEELGIDINETSRGMMKWAWRKGFKRGVWSQLTEEQREEIRTMITAKLEEWGIEVPEENMRPHPPWIRDLTEEQRAEIKLMVEDLKDTGASIEEIKDAVDKKLAEWDIVIPDERMLPNQ